MGGLIFKMVSNVMLVSYYGVYGSVKSLLGLLTLKSRPFCGVAMMKSIRASSPRFEPYSSYRHPIVAPALQTPLIEFFLLVSQGTQGKNTSLS